MRRATLGLTDNYSFRGQKDGLHQSHKERKGYHISYYMHIPSSTGKVDRMPTAEDADY